MWSYRGALVEVIDGDTYVLDLDLGFHVKLRVHVRLLGIDCPEKNTHAGRAAKAFAQEWFGGFGHVLVTTQKGGGKTEQVKTFDRWVASIVGLDKHGAPVPGADLAVTLRAQGHVKPVERLG